MGDNSSRVSPVSAYLASRGTNSLYFRVSFQRYFYNEQPWKVDTWEGRYSISPEQRAGWLIALEGRDDIWLQSQEPACLLPMMKDSASLSLGFLSCNTARWCAGVTRTSVHGQGNQGKCVDSPDAAITVINCPLSPAPNLMPCASVTLVG